MQALEIFTPAQRTGLPTQHEERLIKLWLKRLSASTQKGYDRDLEYYRRWLGAETKDAAVEFLLGYGHGGAVASVLDYQAYLEKDRGLAPATVNRRIACLKSICKLARSIDKIDWALDVPNLRAQAYKDTAGPGLNGFRQMLASFDDLPDTPKHRRDRCLILFLCINGLRRKEVRGISMDDLELGSGRCWILGKHRKEKEWISLSKPVQAALEAWLEVRPPSIPDDDGDPVFVSLDNRCRGGRLDGESINRISQAIGRRVGLPRVNAHSLRHCGATALLDAGTAPRTVMKWGRWRSLNVVAVYDDSRADLAGAAGDILAGKVAQ